MTEPVVTRAHREIAADIFFRNTLRILPDSDVAEWVNTGRHPDGGNGILAMRMATALATIEHNARRDAEPKWILASAELPDSDVRVLVRCTDGDIVSAELEFTDDSEGHGRPYWVSEGSDLALRDYPHWMPRPEDPPPVGPNNG